MKTNSSIYLIQSGWVSADKRTGLGDAEVEVEDFITGREAADEVFNFFVQSDGKTSDRGDRWVHAVVEMYQADENGEFTGQPVREFRSQP